MEREHCCLSGSVIFESNCTQLNLGSLVSVETASSLSVVPFEGAFFNLNCTVLFGEEDASELSSVILVETEEALVAAEAEFEDASLQGLVVGVGGVRVSPY